MVLDALEKLGVHSGPPALPFLAHLLVVLQIVWGNGMTLIVRVSFLLTRSANGKILAPRG
jgi:hypothetical protein